MWRCGPTRDISTSFLRFLYHTQRLLWTNDQPVAEISTLQNRTLTTDKHPCSWLDSNPQPQQARGRKSNTWTARSLGPAVKTYRNEYENEIWRIFSLISTDIRRGQQIILPPPKKPPHSLKWIRTVGT
jgi:hypothetical protein